MAQATGTFSTSGNNLLVAAPGAGLQIVITGWQLSSAGAVTAILQDGSATPNKLTTLTFAASSAGVGSTVSNGDLAPEPNASALIPSAQAGAIGEIGEHGTGQQWAAAPGQALNLNLSAAVAVIATVNYVIKSAL